MDITTSLLKFVASKRSIWSEKTMGTYEAAVDDFKDCLIELGIDKDGPTALLTPDVLVEIPTMLLDHHSARTAKNYIGVIASYIRWCFVEGYSEPTARDTERIRIAFEEARKRKEKVLPRDPEIEDVDKIIEAVRHLDYSMEHGDLLRDRNLSICHFLRSSGCRVGEINGLQCGEFNFKLRRVWVVGKGNHNRKVYFDTVAADALEWYWKARGYKGRDDPAWTRHDKYATDEHKPITTNAIRDFVGKAAGIADIYFTPHYFRHAFGKRVLLETGNLALVQDLLGHKSPVSTRVYATMNDEQLREAYREIFK